MMRIFISTLLVALWSLTSPTDIEICGTVRYQIYVFQDVTSSYDDAAAHGLSDTLTEIMEKIEAVIPGSYYAGFTFRDSTVFMPGDGTIEGGGFAVLTPLTDIDTMKSALQLISPVQGGGFNSNAYEVMYYIAVNDNVSGRSAIASDPGVHDIKVFIVFTDGTPEYRGCGPSTTKSDECCESDHRNLCPKSQKGLDCVDVDQYTKDDWDAANDCPMDIPILQTTLENGDFYVVYVNSNPLKDWFTESGLDMPGRYQYIWTDYEYTNLPDLIIKSLNNITCSLAPSNPTSAPSPTETIEVTTGSEVVVTTTGLPMTTQEVPVTEVTEEECEW